MWKWLSAQGPTFQALLITAIGGVAAVLAYAWVGWIGIGLLGLAVLLVAVRIDLFEDAVAGDMTLGSSVYKRQVEERSRRDPRKTAASADSRLTAIDVLKTVAAGMIVIGFGMFLFGG